MSSLLCMLPVVPVTERETDKCFVKWFGLGWIGRHRSHNKSIDFLTTALSCFLLQQSAVESPYRLQLMHAWISIPKQSISYWIISDIMSGSQSLHIAGLVLARGGSKVSKQTCKMFNFFVNAGYSSEEPRPPGLPPPALLESPVRHGVWKVWLSLGVNRSSGGSKVRKEKLNIYLLCKQIDLYFRVLQNVQQLVVLK